MQRNGSGVVYLSVFHPDIYDFLSTRKENTDEKTRIKTLSLGITVPNKFYELVDNGSVMYLFSPIDVERVYGKPFSYVDITAEYDNLVNNESVRKYQIDARELDTEISKLQQESGYPFVMNIDTINEANHGYGYIIMSNLCTEITQEMIPSVINTDLTYETLGRDNACHLGSTIMNNLVATGKQFGRKVELMVRALNVVADQMNVEGIETINEGNDRTHAIGLGVMGTHSFFARNKMHYGDKESLDAMNAYMMTLKFYALKASMELSKELGRYDGFEESKYATGTAIPEYLTKIVTTIQTDKVREIFKDVDVPTEGDWLELSDNIQEHGIRNKYLLAVAPNGSISYVAEESASISPIVSRIEERFDQKSGKTFYPAPYLSNETMEYYTSAYDMNMMDMIDVYAIASVHVDQAISMSVYFKQYLSPEIYTWKNPKQLLCTTRDISLIRMYAYKKGIRTMYYTRTYIEDEDGNGHEVSVESCESCLV